MISHKGAPHSFLAAVSHFSVQPLLYEFTLDEIELGTLRKLIEDLPVFILRPTGAYVLCVQASTTESMESLNHDGLDAHTKNLLEGSSAYL